jgi:maltose O-acetyltransferase
MISAFIKKHHRRIYIILGQLVQLPRIAWFRFLSDNSTVIDKSNRIQPVILSGKGDIYLGKCNLGVRFSPYLFSGYMYIEARESGSKIEIGDNVYINNNAVIVADKTTISIGNNTLIGPEFSVYDSDFHEQEISKRMSGNHICSPVSIGINVFIGARVTILKGVSIGDNSIIGNGSIVVTSVPPNTIAVGVPAKVISTFQ